MGTETDRTVAFLKLSAPGHRSAYRVSKALLAFSCNKTRSAITEEGS